MEQYDAKMLAAFEKRPVAQSTGVKSSLTDQLRQQTPDVAKLSDTNALNEKQDLQMKSPILAPFTCRVYLALWNEAVPSSLRVHVSIHINVPHFIEHLLKQICTDGQIRHLHNVCKLRNCKDLASIFRLEPADSHGM